MPLLLCCYTDEYAKAILRILQQGGSRVSLECWQFAEYQNVWADPDLKHIRSFGSNAVHSATGNFYPYTTNPSTRTLRGTNYTATPSKHLRPCPIQPEPTWYLLLPSSHLLAAAAYPFQIQHRARLVTPPTAVTPFRRTSHEAAAVTQAPRLIASRLSARTAVLCPLQPTPKRISSCVTCIVCQQALHTPAHTANRPWRSQNLQAAAIKYVVLPAEEGGSGGRRTIATRKHRARHRSRSHGPFGYTRARN